MMMDRFRFTSRPFTREMRVGERYKVDFPEREIVALRQAVEGRGSAALIGPAGSGKTVVLRALHDSLPEARYRTHYIKVTDLSNRDLCREICSAIGAKPAASYPYLVRSIQEKFAATIDGDGMRPVVFFDDAHEMRPWILGVLRTLTNFEMDSRLVVSIILAGQPRLKELVTAAGSEDVRQRMVHCGELRLFSREETQGYLEHRVRIAGATVFPFDRGACEAIFEMTRGNMRAIDQLATKALEKADEAGRDTVSAGDVMMARGSVWI
jgi:general secretion pathway protein A